MIDFNALLTRKVEGGHLKPVVGIVELATLTSGGEVQVLKVDDITGALVIEDEATWASINGNVVCRWVEDKSGVNAAPTVLTDGPSGDQPGIYYNLVDGDIVMISQLCVELTTFSDTVDFTIGFTDAIDGGGTYTPVMPTRSYKTGATARGFDGYTFDFYPPGRIRYADGARSITMRVQTNDAGATITPAWHAYIINP